MQFAAVRRDLHVGLSELKLHAVTGLPDMTLESEPVPAGTRLNVPAVYGPNEGAVWVLYNAT